MAAKTYYLNLTHFASQVALEREVKTRLKEKPRDRIFTDDLFREIVNKLHPDVMASRETSSGEFEILSWGEQERRGMQTSLDYRGGEVVMTHFLRLNRWLDVTLYPWKRPSSRQQVINGLRAKIARVLPHPCYTDRCAEPGCKESWKHLEYHHVKPTFKELVDAAMQFVTEQEIDQRFGYNKFTPDTYSVADFIPSDHPALMYLYFQHRKNQWEWRCPLHHRGKK